MCVWYHCNVVSIVMKISSLILCHQSSLFYTMLTFMLLLLSFVYK